MIRLPIADLINDLFEYTEYGACAIFAILKLFKNIYDFKDNHDMCPFMQMHLSIN